MVLLWYCVFAGLHVTGPKGHGSKIFLILTLTTDPNLTLTVSGQLAVRLYLLHQWPFRLLTVWTTWTVTVCCKCELRIARPKWHVAWLVAFVMLACQLCGLALFVRSSACGAVLRRGSQACVCSVCFECLDIFTGHVARVFWRPSECCMWNLCLVICLQ